MCVCPICVSVCLSVRPICVSVPYVCQGVCPSHMCVCLSVCPYHVCLSLCIFNNSTTSIPHTPEGRAKGRRRRPISELGKFMLNYFFSHLEVLKNKIIHFIILKTYLQDQKCSSASWFWILSLRKTATGITLIFNNALPCKGWAVCCCTWPWRPTTRICWFRTGAEGCCCKELKINLLKSIYH